MNTAEKRRDLEAKGKPWPDCDCHGEPVLWQRDSRMVAGGRFVCRLSVQKWRSRRREQYREAGLCVHCGAETVTESLCQSCADRHADVMAKPKQRLGHRRVMARRRRRKREAEGLTASGIGLKVFAEYVNERTGD